MPDSINNYVNIYYRNPIYIHIYIFPIGCGLNYTGNRITNFLMYPLLSSSRLSRGPRVPARNSSGSAKTLMFVNISPAKSEVEESLNSLA